MFYVCMVLILTQFGNFIRYRGNVYCNSEGGADVCSTENECFFSGYPNPHPVQKTNRKLSNLSILFRNTVTVSNKCYTVMELSEIFGKFT
jgi:hypothetical protein